MKDLSKDYLIYLARNPEAHLYATWGVYETLWAIGELTAFELIAQGLESQEWLVQTAAVDNLIQMGDRRALEPILALLQQKKWKDYDIRRDVVEMLKESAWWKSRSASHVTSSDDLLNFSACAKLSSGMPL